MNVYFKIYFKASAARKEENINFTVSRNALATDDWGMVSLRAGVRGGWGVT